MSLSTVGMSAGAQFRDPRCDLSSHSIDLCSLGNGEPLIILHF